MGASDVRESAAKAGSGGDCKRVGCGRRAAPGSSFCGCCQHDAMQRLGRVWNGGELLTGYERLVHGAGIAKGSRRAALTGSARG